MRNTKRLVSKSVTTKRRNLLPQRDSEIGSFLTDAVFLRIAWQVLKEWQHEIRKFVRIFS